MASYAETEALVALMDGDEDAARAILDDFLPNERAVFIEQLSRLLNFAHCYCSRCGKRVEDHTDLITITDGGTRERICHDCDVARAEEKRAVRARRREIARLVLDAVMQPGISSYGHLAEVTGIDVGRLQAIRDKRTDATDDEVRRLRAFLTERAVP